MHKKKIDQKVLFLLILVVVSAVSFAVGFVSSDNYAVGATAVYSGVNDENDWDPSGDSTSGMIFLPAENTICFPTTGSPCDVNVQWDGTDLILNGGS